MRPDPDVVREIVWHQKWAALMHRTAVRCMEHAGIGHSPSAIVNQLAAAKHAFMARTALIALINGESDANA